MTSVLNQKRIVGEYWQERGIWKIMMFFELLVRNGFSNMYICSCGEGYYGEELIIRKNDIKAAKI